MAWPLLLGAEFFLWGRTDGLKLTYSLLSCIVLYMYGYLYAAVRMGFQVRENSWGFPISG